MFLLYLIHPKMNISAICLPDDKKERKEKEDWNEILIINKLIITTISDQNLI